MSSKFRHIIHVPENQRTETWVKEVCDELIDWTYSDFREKEKVAKCRQMYQDGKYADSYDHLYGSVAKKVEDDCGQISTVHLVPPAKVRHIPIIKSMIRRLVSEERERPVVPRAFVTDAINSEKKEDRFIQEINILQEQRIKTRIQALQLQQQVIDLQRQAIQEAGQAPEAKQWVMQLQGELDRLQEVIGRGVQLSNEELEKVGQFFRYSYKDIQELFAEKSVNFHLRDQRLEHLFNRNFEEKLVTGKEIFFVDWEPGMEDPVYEQLFWEQCYFPYNESVMYLHEHSWGIRRSTMSLDNIIAKWGNQIDRTLFNKIKEDAGIWNQGGSNTYYTPDGVQLPENMPYNRQHGSTDDDEYSVHYCYFKTHAKIPVLYSPNKHRDNAPDFVKILDEEEGEYLKGKPEKLKKKGQRLEWRYRQDLYRGIRVGNDTFLEAGKHPVQLRSETKRSLVPLPFIGHAENYFYDLESLVWETKDIQELYNIYHYQKELLTVLAGVRGVIVDLSQTPEGMELPEVIYYMKHGILPIETVDESGRQKNGSFNQFGTYDQTIAPAIQLLDQTMMMLKSLAGEITGVTDVRQGITGNQDQVGTNQLAYQESSLVTEKLFQDHEDLINLCLTRGGNLSKHAYKKGKRGNFINGDMVMDRVNIPEGMIDYECQVLTESSRKSSRLLQEMQQLVRQQYSQGALTGSAMLGMLDVKSITEMKKLIAEHEQHALEMAGKQQQEQAQMQQQMMEQQAALDARTTQMIEGNKMQMAQMQAQIEKQRMSLDAEKSKADQQLKNKEIDTRAKVDVYKVDTEKAMEGAYLQLQKQEMKLNDENTKTGMLLQQIEKQMEMNMRSKEKVKD